MAALPPDRGLEIAFAGRSNAGKSSAINAITGVKGLARSSKTPGRTQALIVFALDDDKRLVDLPGFGYAKVAESVRRRWHKTLSQYFRRRRALGGLMLIMDARRPLRELDEQMLLWCHDMDLPCHVLLTKADKLKRNEARTTLSNVTADIADAGIRAGVQLFSSHTGEGVDAARRALSAWLTGGDAPANSESATGDDHGSRL